MLTSSYVIDVEDLHVGAAVQITFHPYGVRKSEKRFNGIVIASTPLEVKIDYLDPKEFEKAKKAKRLIRRVFTLEDITSNKVSINRLSPLRGMY